MGPGGWVAFVGRSTEEPESILKGKALTHGRSITGLPVKGGAGSAQFAQKEGKEKNQ